MFRCKHDWKILVDKTLEAPGINFDGLRKLSTDAYTYERLNISTHIVILSCNKCGKINKTITRRVN